MERQDSKELIRPTRVPSAEPVQRGHRQRLPQPQPPCRIALVDGDAHIHLVVRNAVEGEGWRFESYLTAAQAVTGISTKPPNAVLMDIQLPAANGLELLGKLKTLMPHLPIVIFTARDDPEAVLGSLATGADRYLIKPTPPSAIVSAIRDALAGGHAFGQKSGHHAGPLPRSACSPQSISHFA